jgi:hypothetical protein
MQPESQPDLFNVELEGRPTRAYNQAAFRYFLSIEQRRTERTGRPFALLLVERKGQADGRIDTETATTLFAGLSLCLRETDFIGWYDQGTVAGAVLTHLGDTRSGDATHRVRQRVSHVVLAGLLPELAEEFAIHVYQFPAQVQELGEKLS